MFYKQLINNLAGFSASQTRTFFKLIAAEEKLDNEILEYLTRDLNVLTFYSIHRIFIELEKRQFFSDVVESNVASLLGSDNFFIARRAHNFLADRDLSAVTLDKVKQFQQKHIDRLL